MGHTIKLGEPVTLSSGIEPYQLVFEDDGDTGYVYVLDLRRGDEQPIIDALHLYDVREERGDEHEVEFLWRDDGLVAIVFIDDVPQALIDFEEPRFMCRTGFPAPGPDAPVPTHEWDQAAYDAHF
jgi:hypothetical protein